MYRAVPVDPALRFRQTLDAAFGTHYTFRFSDHRGSLRIQSYSVSVTEPLRVGADLYVVHGQELVNFHDISQVGVMGVDTLDIRFAAEAFLAQDTGRRTVSGKTIITIFGGIGWGWQVQKS